MKKNRFITLFNPFGFPDKVTAVYINFLLFLTAFLITFELMQIESDEKLSNEKEAFVSLSKSALSKFLKEEEKYKPLY